MDNFMKIPIKCLSLFGHSLAREEPRSRTCRESIQHILLPIFVASALFPIYLFAIDKENDMLLVTDCLSVAFTNLLTVIKISTFLRNKLQFLRILNQMRDFLLKGDDFAQQQLEKVNTIAGRFVRFYFYSTISTGLYFMISPFLTIIVNQIRKEPTGILKLPMKMKFPFDSSNSPGYEIAYIYTGLITISVVTHAVAIDGFFIISALNIKEHFRILQHQLSTNKFQQKDYSVRRSQLKYYIEYHKIILKLAEQCRQIYQPIIFGQFLMTSLQVCLIVYQLMKTISNVFSIPPFVLFLTSILMQLFIYCYGGEMITVESGKIGNAIQLSNWYNLNPSDRRAICFMMLRSQKPLIIRAGIYDASLQNFIIILKAAMSYITLMQSIEK